MKIAVYPGSFDPITNGHIDLIERASKIFDYLIVAVAENPGKSPLFTIEERISMVKEAIERYDNVTVDSISGLTVDYVKEHEASIIVRGLRAISDFEFELQMALMNRKLNEEIETIFLMPSLQYSYLKSSHIKELAKLGGSLEGLAPNFVIEKLKKKFLNQALLT
ncbi:TPA: pantetheine-phosphate adenylyltransferase [bacterium]|jgi:pantetheine-phosphate adenylyltransferase|nr:pantetheine-phosphate adenylyltransferase [bacterium]